MARPRGYRLSRPAFDDVMRLTLLSMTQIAARAGLPLTTVSGLYNDDNGASERTVERLADGAGVARETLFPELLFSDRRKAVA